MKFSFWKVMLFFIHLIWNGNLIWGSVGRVGAKIASTTAYILTAITLIAALAVTLVSTTITESRTTTVASVTISTITATEAPTRRPAPVSAAVASIAAATETTVTTASVSSTVVAASAKATALTSETALASEATLVAKIVAVTTTTATLLLITTTSTESALAAKVTATSKVSLSTAEATLSATPFIACVASVLSGQEVVKVVRIVRTVHAFGRCCLEQIEGLSETCDDLVWLAAHLTNSLSGHRCTLWVDLHVEIVLGAQFFDFLAATADNASSLALMNQKAQLGRIVWILGWLFLFNENEIKMNIRIYILILKSWRYLFE
jgi:hypothetical protein